MDKRFKVMPKLVQHKTSPTKEDGCTKGGSSHAFKDQKDKEGGRFRASTPGTGAYPPYFRLRLDGKGDDPTFSSVFHESDLQDMDNTKSKLPITTLSKRLEEQSLGVDIAHARYVQAFYMDMMMKNYINQHKRDETTYLSQLSLLVSNLSDHLAYLERMIMAAKHQKEVKAVISRQETCLEKLKSSLESTIEPYKKLMEAIDGTRHNIQFEGIVLENDELSKFSSLLEKAKILLEKLARIFGKSNLLKSSKAYNDLEVSLEKGLELLKMCNEYTHSLENSVIETSSVRVQVLHKPTK